MAITELHPPATRKRTARETREPLHMRIRPEDRSLIDHAAELAGKNRTDFVIDAARLAAQNTLLGRAVIPLSEKAFAAFVALIDTPPQPNERLRKSLQTPAVLGITRGVVGARSAGGSSHSRRFQFW